VMCRLCSISSHRSSHGKTIRLSARVSTLEKNCTVAVCEFRPFTYFTVEEIKNGA
jgi:hypothetical protein